MTPSIHSSNLSPSTQTLPFPTMKRYLAILILAVAPVVAAFAQTPPAPLTVKGDLRITYNTRTQLDGSKPRAGVVDTYVMNLNIANSAVFKGTISHLPFVSNTLGKNQIGRLGFELDLDVVNPANPSQTRNIGKVFGATPVDEKNVYRFTDGGVKVAVFGMGSAKGFESKFSGLALGKPPASSGFAKMKQEAVRLVSNKGGAITLTRYDKMEFQQHMLPAGPVQIYPETLVTGTLLFDYGRNSWHFNSLTLTYTHDGRRMSDILTGSIRWIEHPQRKVNGQGHYEVDVRLNEPLPSEGAVFAATTDESAFFMQDDANPALTGTLVYKDAMSNGTVTSSYVTVDLKGNRLSKQQLMALSKLLFMSALVPINAE